MCVAYASCLQLSADCDGRSTLRPRLAYSHGDLLLKHWSCCSQLNLLVVGG